MNLYIREYGSTANVGIMLVWSYQISGAKAVDTNMRRWHVQDQYCNDRRHCTDFHAVHLANVLIASMYLWPHCRRMAQAICISVSIYTSEAIMWYISPPYIASITIQCKDSLADRQKTHFNIIVIRLTIACYLTYLQSRPTFQHFSL